MYSGWFADALYFYLSKYKSNKRKKKGEKRLLCLLSTIISNILRNYRKEKKPKNQTILQTQLHIITSD